MKKKRQSLTFRQFAFFASIALALMGFVLVLPPVQHLLLRFAEKFLMHRPLGMPEMWIGVLKRLAHFCVNAGLFSLFWLVSDLSSFWKNHAVLKIIVFSALIYLASKNWRYGVFFAFIVLLCCAYRAFVGFYSRKLPERIESAAQIEPLSKGDRKFLILACSLCAAVCLFQFWLGFPGFYSWSSDNRVILFLEKSNWHPVVISCVLDWLSLIFGKHLFWLFLLTIVPFYAGLAFLICGFYLRFRTKKAILLFFTAFLENFFLGNFLCHDSFTLSAMLFCLYSTAFFYFANPDIKETAKQKLRWLLFAEIFVTLFWRHNAIVSVWPIFFAVVFEFLSGRSLKKKPFLKHYCVLLLLSFFASCLCLVTGEKILQESPSVPSQHIFLHQIAGCCVPSDDDRFIDKGWLLEGKTFEDVKKVYLEDKTDGDRIGAPWREECPFNVKVSEKLPGIKKKWIFAIFHHPVNFAIHELRMMKRLWLSNLGWYNDFSAKDFQFDASAYGFTNGCPKNEYVVVYSSFHEKILQFLLDKKIFVSALYAIIACYLSFITSVMFLSKRHTLLLMLSISASVSGIFASIFIPAFSPVVFDYRYMMPIFPVAIVSLVALGADMLSQKKFQ